jgi:disulfide bond formation protein DsbB
MFIDVANKILAGGTVGSFVFIFVTTLYLFLRKNNFDIVVSFLKKHGIFFAFLVSFFGTAGSVFYSEIAGYEPCSLCIIQRFFLFPQVPILLAILSTKNFRLLPVSLILSFLGWSTALYHIFISYGGKELIPCSAESVSCSLRYVYEFGFVTIPFMALATFSLIIFFVFVGSEQK